MALSPQKIEAAVMVAHDELTDEAIAERIGITRRTLANWKNNPEFSDYVDEENRKVQAAMLRLDIAKRHKRVARLNELHDKLFTVIDERAASLAGEAPGGGTGLLVHQVKVVGSGPSAQMVDEYVVDAGTIREIRALQEQAASELGQKIDKVSVTGDLVVRRYIGVSPEDV